MSLRFASIVRAGVLGVAAVLTASACAGASADGGSEVASLDDAASSDSSPTSESPEDSQQAFLAYAQCLRDEGLDVNDPTFDADGNPTGGLFGPDSGLDPSSEEFQAAQAVCGELLEGVTFGGGGRGFDTEAIREASLALTECLRDEGLAVDDLQFGEPGAGGPFGGPPDGSAPDSPGGGGGPFGQGGDPTDRLAEVLGLDPDDPEVAAALEVCGDLFTSALPQGGGTTETTES